MRDEAQNRGARREERQKRLRPLEPWKFSQGRTKIQRGFGESTTIVGLEDKEIWTFEEIS
jgi:hypothetical protein